MCPSSDVRLLRDMDVDAYVRIRREMIGTEPFAFLGAPGDDAGGSADAVRRNLADPDHAIVGAFEAGKLVAVAGIYREKRLKLRHRAGIWGVYTTPAARRQGLSRRVVSACVDIARTWPGVVVVGLSVSQRAAGAQRLYRDLGFTPWGIQPESIRVDGESDTEIHMQFYLPGAVRNQGTSFPNNSGT